MCGSYNCLLVRTESFFFSGSCFRMGVKFDLTALCQHKIHQLSVGSGSRMEALTIPIGNGRKGIEIPSPHGFFSVLPITF